MKPGILGGAAALTLLLGTAAYADCNDHSAQQGKTTRCDNGSTPDTSGRGMGTNTGGNNAPMKGAPYNGSGTDGGTSKGTYGGATPNATTPGSGGNSGDATGGAGSGPPANGGANGSGTGG